MNANFKQYKEELERDLKPSGLAFLARLGCCPYDEWTRDYVDFDANGRARFSEHCPDYLSTSWNILQKLAVLRRRARDNADALAEIEDAGNSIRNYWANCRAYGVPTAKDDPDFGYCCAEDAAYDDAAALYECVSSRLIEARDILAKSGDDKLARACGAFLKHMDKAWDGIQRDLEELYAPDFADLDDDEKSDNEGAADVETLDAE